MYTQVVGGDNHTIFVLDGDYRRSSDNRRLCVLCGTGGLKVCGVVLAVDIISGLHGVVSRGQMRPCFGSLHGPKLAGSDSFW